MNRPAILFCLALIAVNRLVMFIEGRRKDMAACAIGDEIQRSAGRGLNRRQQRRRAGQRNRGRRQAFAGLGVIGRIGEQILPAQVAVKRRAQAINHGGIGLQRHVFLQTPDKDAGDLRPFPGLPGFLLND